MAHVWTNQRAKRLTKEVKEEMLQEEMEPNARAISKTEINRHENKNECILLISFVGSTELDVS